MKGFFIFRTQYFSYERPYDILKGYDIIKTVVLQVSGSLILNFYVQEEIRCLQIVKLPVQ